MLARLGDSAEFRITYLDGVLEIVSPSLRHENIKSCIGDLLPIYFLETNTEYYPTGSTTFRRRAKKGGTEADESYCIGTDKQFPDLAIEVVITGGGIHKLAVYQQLGVAEVWFWQGDRFSLYRLREPKPARFSQTYGYELVGRSELLPDLDPVLLAEYVRHPHPLTAVKEFQGRLREQLSRR